MTNGPTRSTYGASRCSWYSRTACSNGALPGGKIAASSTRPAYSGGTVARVDTLATLTEGGATRPADGRLADGWLTGGGHVAYYRQVGEVPPKRHIQFRDDAGALLYEELMGEEGFSSDSSLLYHRGVPSAIV